MDVLANYSIFQELQLVHDTGYFSALPSLEENWQQVCLTGTWSGRGALVCPSVNPSEKSPEKAFQSCSCAGQMPKPESHIAVSVRPVSDQGRVTPRERPQAAIRGDGSAGSHPGSLPVPE
ncbi:hypothetical protein AOLI_G00081460 [Acnodon oligacanthus]